MALDTEIEGRVATRVEEELKEPEEYRVLLFNDDFTTMEFVVSVLMTVFHKPLPEATTIMLDVHKKGRGLVGVYSYDQLARQNGFPLKCTMEKA
jgi:ATP-dependent Clp protease adaptor protein ClpS